MIETELFKLNKTSVNRFQYIEINRVILFTCLLNILTFLSLLFNVEGIPFLYLEIIFLAPFLQTRIGLLLSLISISVAASRLIEGIFGFDQIFVSGYYLINNFLNFPSILKIQILLFIIVAFAIFILIWKKLPVKLIKIPNYILGIIFLSIPVAKIGEDYIHQNLIGSSYGYLAGQLMFSNMLNSAYKTPGVHPSEFPGLYGAKLAASKKLSYLLIVVESMGQPVNEEFANEMISSFRSDSVQAKYHFSLGQTYSIGSTIHGEIRQLCNGKLQEGLFSKRNENCIPDIFKQLGYRTRAVHANAATVYGRDIWYPSIGFNEIAASDTEPFLMGKRSHLWGTMLDFETIPWATRTMRTRDGKDFTYVLTVSTHLPANLLPGVVLSQSCLESSTLHACVHMANLKAVLESVAQASTALQDTVIMVTGDHPPKFWSESSRDFFSRTDVPWLMLLPIGKKELPN